VVVGGGNASSSRKEWSSADERDVGLDADMHSPDDDDDDDDDDDEEEDNDERC
jgi:hypothetical protein